MSITAVFPVEEFQESATSQTGICHVILTQQQFGQIMSTSLKVKMFGRGITIKKS